MWAMTCKNLPLWSSVITHKKIMPQLHHYHLKILPVNAYAGYLFKGFNYRLVQSQVKCVCKLTVVCIT